MIQRFSNLFSRFMCGLVMTSFFFAVPLLCFGADLTLPDAVDEAILNNPGLQAAIFHQQTAREKTLQARSGAFPHVQVSGQLNHTTNPMWAFGTRLNQERITNQDFDPARLNDPDGITNYSSIISLIWPVYDSGQTWFGTQQARLNQEAADLSVKRIRQQVIAGVITAYNGALMARENQSVVSRILETAEIHLNLVQSRYDGGFVAKSDLLRAQVHMAELEQQLSDAKSRTDISICRLSVAMGTAENRDFILITPLEAGDPIAGGPEVWVATALSTRPDLQYLAIRKRIAEKEINKAKAARLPSVSLTGNYEINSEDLQETGTNSTIGAVVSIPLFTGGRISAKIREAETGLKQITSTYKAMEQQICSETRQAFFNARSAWERIRVAQATVGQSEESLRIVRNRYKSGLFTITDLLDAEVMVHQSLTNHLKAVHDYRAAAALLELAAGVLDKMDRNSP